MSSTLQVRLLVRVTNGGIQRDHLQRPARFTAGGALSYGYSPAHPPWELALMSQDQNPLKDWSSLGNNMIWRADGAVVYPLFQKPRGAPSVVPWGSDKPVEPTVPPKGPWLARHPVGGFLERFPTTELAVRAIDSVHPLVSDTEFIPSPEVARLLEKLKKDPALISGITQALAPLARMTVCPWERSPSFGGSMVRTGSTGPTGCGGRSLERAARR